MRPSALYDPPVILFQPCQFRCQGSKRRQKAFFEGYDCRDMHRCRECVVGALRHIDRIVRMQELRARDLVSAVGDYFVDVHIGLGAAPCLPDDKRKITVELPLKDLVADFPDQPAPVVVKFPEPVVGYSSCLFQYSERADDLPRHLLRPDPEILVTSLRLRAPMAVSGDPHLSHRIMFNPVFHRNLIRLIQHSRQYTRFPYRSFRPARSCSFRSRTCDRSLCRRMIRKSSLPRRVRGFLHPCCPT